MVVWRESSTCSSIAAASGMAQVIAGAAAPRLAAVAQTAIIVPLLEAEPLLGAFRERHTAEGAQGMPAHVTLLYPFTDTTLLDAARIAAVADVIGGFEAFAVSLGPAARFPENDRVLSLRPDPESVFRAMTSALGSAFPEHEPYGGKYADPIPHATVAIGDDALLAEIERELAPHLPVAAQVTEATLVELDDATSTWRVRHRLPLG